MKKWWTRVSTTRPWWVLGSSLVVLAALGWYASGLFQHLSADDSFAASGTAADLAQKRIEAEFGASPSSEILLFERVDDQLGDAKSPAFQQKVLDLLKPLRDDVESITTYTSQPNDAFISHDGAATYAVVVGKSDRAATYHTLQQFADHADQSQVKISVGGTAATIEQTTGEVSKDLVQAEMISLPILLVLLLVFFRSGVASLVPLGMSGVTIVGAFAIARFISSFISIDQYAVNVITILGLGLSIDYALLSINRFREELERHSSVSKAVGTIIATSGTTIVFSGITVIACLAALLFFPMEFLHSIAVGGSAAVVMAMLFTVVILPSLLQVMGKHINSWRIPFLQRPKRTQQSNFWTRVASFSTSRPCWVLGGSLAVVGVLLIPLTAFKLQSGMDYHWFAQGSSSQYVAKQLATVFPSASPSITVVTTYPATLSTADKTTYSCEITQTLQAISGVKRVMSATPLSDTLKCDTVRAVQSYAALSDQEKQFMQLQQLPAPDSQTVAQLAALEKTYTRDQALRFDVVVDGQTSPQAYSALADIRALTPGNNATLHVGGMTALLHDTDNAYARAIPWVVGVIALAMFVLLSWHLRSFVLPLQAIVINIVAIVVSLSLLVGIFELGWGSQLLGWGTTNGIIMTPIVLITTIAFGLAMDYSVFLYSRMHEEHEKTQKPVQAITHGMIKTGPIITAAALMMFVVVSAFAGSSVMIMQMIGVGLGIAVLVDAFFVRLFLVPSIMALMGKASWWSPLPRDILYVELNQENPMAKHKSWHGADIKRKRKAQQKAEKRKKA